MMNKWCTVWVILAVMRSSTGMHSSRRGGAGGLAAAEGRNQHFIIKPDGSYSFAFNTETGGYQNEEKANDGSVSGSYGFSGPEGSNVQVQYSAGGGGSSGGSSSNYGQHEYKQATSYKQSSNEDYGSSYGGGNLGGGAGSYSLSLNPDGTYTYEYSTSDQSKAESRTADGKVKGQFSYTGKDGQNRKITYTADEGGFQPLGDHIPVADQPAPSSYSNSGSSYSSNAGSYSGGASSYSGGASSYSSGSSNNGGSGTLNMKFNPGGHYEYSYKLNDQSKSESNAGGKVKGEYSYTGPDGETKSITYTADEGGFKPMGDHIPKPSAEYLEAYQSAKSAHGSQHGYSGGNYGGNAGGGSHDSYSSGNTGSGNAYSSGSSAGGAGSYAFNYDTQDHGHSQSASGQGVSGQYSVQTEGLKQKVTYNAGGKQGFNPTVEFSTAVGGGSGGRKAASGYSAHHNKHGGATAYASASGASAGGYSSDGSAGGSSGGSYSFQYNTGDHSHSQSGGSGVSGQYSVGNTQKVSYSSGGSGYKPTVEVNAAIGKHGGSSYNAGSAYNSGNSYKSSSHGDGSGHQGGTYSYSYVAGAHDHQESSSAGQSQGKYNVQSSGATQKTQYTAGKTGFLPTHDIMIQLGGGSKKQSYHSGY